LAERFDLGRLAPSLGEFPLYRPVGCPECRGTGYRGRRAIAELLLPSVETDRLMFQRADQNAIERAAVANGMRPIFDAGLLAVIEGDTTIEEVIRCIRSEA
jgi:general secretion pathway protein E